MLRGVARNTAAATPAMRNRLRTEIDLILSARQICAAVVLALLHSVEITGANAYEPRSPSSEVTSDPACALLASLRLPPVSPVQQGPNNPLASRSPQLTQ